MAEFKTPTEAEFEAITKRTIAERKHPLLAISARHDRRSGKVMITLNNGTVVGFPLAVLPGLENATPEQLGKIEIQGHGYGLHVAALDADIAIPQLLEDQLGSKLMARARSRALASKANGRLGGRPRKPKPAAA